MGKNLSGAQKRKKKREKESCAEAGGYGAVEAWTDEVVDRDWCCITRMCLSRMCFRN